MGRKKEKTENEEIKDMSKWSKMLKRDMEWTKDEILDVVYVVRQILAVIMGITWGCIPLLGTVGIISYLAISVVVLFIYYTHFLGINDEVVVGRTALIQEGFMPSFSLFVVFWIIFYNLLYVDKSFALF